MRTILTVLSLQQWDIPVYILLGIQKRKLQSTQSVIIYNHWKYWNCDQDKLFENLYAFFHFNYYKRFNFAPKKTSCVNIAGKLCNSGLNNLKCILWFWYSTCQENPRIFTITETVKSSSLIKYGMFGSFDIFASRLKSLTHNL